MKVTKQDIMHIAELSRLYISDSEADNLHMEDIIAFADKLKELDTENINPTNHVLNVSNVLREDVVCESTDRDTILNNAPQKGRGCFVVPKVVE